MEEPRHAHRQEVHARRGRDYFPSDKGVHAEVSRKWNLGITRYSTAMKDWRLARLIIPTVTPSPTFFGLKCDSTLIRLTMEAADSFRESGRSGKDASMS